MKIISKSKKYLMPRTLLNNFEKKAYEKRNKYIKRNGRLYVPVTPKFSGNFNAVDVTFAGQGWKTVNTSNLKNY